MNGIASGMANKKMKIKNSLKFIISVVGSELVGFLGSFFTMSGTTSWYDALVKPPLNPPTWIFAPVWIALYFIMGISLGMVWSSNSGYKKKAIILFVVQLALNAIWTPVFFGVHMIGNSLAIIVLLWAAIVMTIFIFSKVSRVAAWLLAPYVVWVSFAAYLNVAFWVLN